MIVIASMSFDLPWDQTRPSAGRLLNEWCKSNDCTVGEIRSRNRQKLLTAKRWRAIRYLRRKGFSVTQIGDAVRRDHTSVLNALKKGQPYQ